HRACVAQGACSAVIAGALCPSDDTADHGKSGKCQLDHMISCVQSQLITWDMYTDHQGIDDQCALMISVPQKCHLSVSISVSSQCSSVPRASAHQCHINATYQCIPVHINATYQCIPVHINATYQ
ncbi:unnamed protein product, partial [Staurois parvus]